MPDVLIFADTIRSPELRHEIPLPVPDAFLYLERDGKRTAVVSSLEAARIREAAPDVGVAEWERFGLDELVAQGMAPAERELEIASRACQEAGISNAVVPPSFPVGLADHLRANGIELRPVSTPTLVASATTTAEWELGMPPAVTNSMST